MTDRPRICILGTGIRGSLYARAVMQNPAADLVGLSDLDAAAGQRVAAEFGVPFFASVDELVAGSAPSALVVATPDFAHREGVLAAAAAGLHLMVEKPLAMSTHDARDMVDAVTAGGGRSMLAFENRWNPRFVAAHAARETTVGDVRHQVLHLNDTRWVPTTMLTWAAKSSPGWFLMPHSLDIALWMSGKAVISVYASGSRGLLDAVGVRTWDAIDAHLDFADGTSATLHSCWVLPDGYPAVYDFRYEAVGSVGAMRVEGAAQGLDAFGQRHDWPQWGTYELAGRLHGFPVDMVDTFVRVASGENVDVPDVHQGLLVTRIIEAIHQSVERAVPIAVQEQ